MGLRNPAVMASALAACCSALRHLTFTCTPLMLSSTLAWTMASVTSFAGMRLETRIASWMKEWEKRPFSLRSVLTAFLIMFSSTISRSVHNCLFMSGLPCCTSLGGLEAWGKDRDIAS
eukprot:2553461-Heterocapsa_arctica.AAC.1